MVVAEIVVGTGIGMVTKIRVLMIALASNWLL